MQTRRQFIRSSGWGISAVALCPTLNLSATEKVDLTVAGVKLGLITGSLNPPRTAPPAPPPVPPTLDELIQDCVLLRAANVEYIGPVVGKPMLIDGVIGQPPPVITDAYRSSREQVKQWNLTTSLEPFREARQKFDAAGLNLFSGVNTIAADCADEEIDAIFRQMNAMGVKIFCTNQTRLGIAPRMAPFAKKYDIRPAFHTHDKSENPDEVASAESLEKLLTMSPLFMINLDIGHYTAGNQDAVAFIKAHHDRITHLHIKDRKKNHGPNVPLGEGDTPIKECLRLIRDNHYPIYAIVEREYPVPPGSTSLQETQKCLAYMKDALLT
jgi:sugar phosphate isomerase/epimerase